MDDSVEDNVRECERAGAEIMLLDENEEARLRLREEGDFRLSRDAARERDAEGTDGGEWG